MRDIYLKKLEASNDSDVLAFLAIANDPEVEKFVNYMHIEKKDFAESFFKTATILGIFDDSSHKLVGAMHVTDSDPDVMYSHLEVAYFIGKEYRNMGYAKAAVQALRKKYANSKFSCLTFYVDLENLASLAVLRSANEVIERRFDPYMHVFIVKL
mgnify:CR=1 FL=1